MIPMQNAHGISVSKDFLAAYYFAVSYRMCYDTLNGENIAIWLSGSVTVVITIGKPTFIAAVDTLLGRSRMCRLWCPRRHPHYSETSASVSYGLIPIFYNFVCVCVDPILFRQLFGTACLLMNKMLLRNHEGNRLLFPKLIRPKISWMR